MVDSVILLLYSLITINERKGETMRRVIRTKKQKYPRLGWVTIKQIEKHKESGEKSHKYHFSHGYLGIEVHICSICSHTKDIKIPE